MADQENRIPIWLWPNVLSLDAPVVAVIWQALLASASKVQLGWAEPAALFLAVWVIYLADRILDALRPAPSGWEPARKKFYRRRLRQMSPLCVACALTGATIACVELSPTLLYDGTLLLLCVACYFLLVHSRLGDRFKGWPRELAVAGVFSLGAYFPIAVLTNYHRLQPWSVVILALLCAINCSTIETWEWHRNPSTAAPSQAARWIESHLSAILPLTSILCLLLLPFRLVSFQYSASATISCLCFAIVSSGQFRISASLTRVAADVALCSPLLVLLVQGLR